MARAADSRGGGPASTSCNFLLLGLSGPKHDLRISVSGPDHLLGLHYQSEESLLNSYFFGMFLSSISSAEASRSNHSQERRRGGLFHQTSSGSDRGWQAQEAHSSAQENTPLGWEPRRAKAPGLGLLWNFQLHGVNASPLRLS